MEKMSVNLTQGAISKISSGACTWNDLKPVLQVIYTSMYKRFIEDKEWNMVLLSDGSCFQFCFIEYKVFISNKVWPVGSIVQLTMFHLVTNKLSHPKCERHIRVSDLNLIRSKCDTIGAPKQYRLDKTPLVGESSTSSDDYNLDVVLDDIFTEELINRPQSPSTSTQNKKQKLHSLDDIISGFGKHISNVRNMMVEITNDVRVSYKKLGTLEEDVSKMKKIMMDKNKEDDVGSCFRKLEALEENVSKLSRMMMEKNKEDDMEACIEKLEKMGWEAEDPLYDTALLLFGESADYRKLWLQMKPESCDKWVQNAGSKFGLLG